MQVRLLSQTLLLAFCSMVYELLLAQAMSAALGDTTFRYATTIGLFMAAMGAGSLAANTGNSAQEAAERLFRLELLIMAVGAASPFVILFLLRVSPSASLLSYALVIGIGFLTGRELPLLLALSDKRSSFGAILAADYAGMFVAALLFPFVLLPKLGLFGTAFLVAALNSLLAAQLALATGRLRKTLPVATSLALAVALIAASVASTAWTEALGRMLFLGGGQ